MEDFIVSAFISSYERNYYERMRLREIRDKSNPMEIPDVKFKKIFRIPKTGAVYLFQALDSPALNEGHIPKEIKILATLNFFAQGSYQTPVGQDNLLGLSQPTVSRCIEAVTGEVNKNLTPIYIKFPMTESEKMAAKAKFQQLFGMPNTLGAVDGTHIPVIQPSKNHPTAPGNLFYNRKGFYSINCQIICSATGYIIGVNPNFPGSTHDAAVWRASKVYRTLRDQYVQGGGEQLLLGDKGYPLQPWLMTPVAAPTSPAEESYNVHHAQARNVVELCHGRLKNVFRCLHRHRSLHYKPEKAAKIIVSCCTLYNMFITDFSDDSVEETNEEEIDSVGGDVETDFYAEACRIRESLIRTYF